MIRPQIDEPTGKFGAIVGKQIARGPALTHQTVESIDDMFIAKTLPHLDRQRFTAEHVDHGQHPELLSVAELIMDKVESPCLFRPFRLKPRPALHAPLWTPPLLFSPGPAFPPRH